MNKVAKPLYTDPEDIKNYENRKRIRRKFNTAVGGVGGGLAGATIGGGIGMGSAGLDYKSRGRKGLIGALLGLGVGATAGALGSRKLNDLSVGYMESAGLDPTIPNFKAKLSVDGQKAAEAAFASGFCKAAETLGVDPVALYKQAGGKGLIGETLGKGINAARGYFGLLGGGNVSKIRKGLETTRRRIGRTNEILQKELPVVGEMPTKMLRADTNNTWFNRTLDRLTGRKRDWDRWEAAVEKWQPKRELYSGLQSRLNAREAELAQALTKEREAVAKTRFLTGVGALGTGGAGYGVYNALQDGGKKAAEAAFAEGFCKAAETLGVDPGVLVKAAGGDDTTRAIGNARLEKLGPWVSTLVAGGVGRGLGRLGRRKLLGTLTGLAVGGAVNGGGKLVAHVTPARTGAAQASHDEKLHLLKSLLLPGYGSYNGVKRLEREKIYHWH